jgi:OmpA family
MAEQAASDEPGDSKHEYRQEVKPQGYAKSGNKGRARRGELWIGPAERRLDEAKPDPQSPYITGRYQNEAAVQGTSEPQMLLHINQAGRWVTCLLVILPKGGGRIQCFRIGGSLFGGKFSLRIEDVSIEDLDEAGTGTLEAVGKDVLLTLKDLGIDQSRFFLHNTRATFLEDSLEPLLEAGIELGGSKTQVQEIQNREIAPLTVRQIEQIDAGFAIEKIKPYLDAYDANASQEQSSAKELAAQAIDQGYGMFGKAGLEVHVGKIINPSRWPKEQLPLARERARWVLASYKLQHLRSLRTALELIESAAADVITSNPSRNLPNLRALLGWPAEGAAPQSFLYKVEIKLKYKEKSVAGGNVAPKAGRFKKLLKDFSAGVSIGAYYGDITVQCFPEDGSKPEWERKLKIVMIGSSIVLGKGSRSGLSAKGEITSVSRWTPKELEGWVKVLDSNAWAGFKLPKQKEVIGKDFRDAMLIINGVENHPRLMIPLKFDADPIEGVGVQGSFMFGWIVSPDTDISDESRQHRMFRYEVRSEKKQDCHFKIGSSIVEGRSEIRQFCALWLPWLTSPDSQLEIIGYADGLGYTDRRDESKRNQELSEMRAQNIRGVIKDILGDHLAIKNVQTKGMGDAYALEQDNPRYTSRLVRRANREHRRVDVLLDGKCVFVVWAA